MSEIKYKKFKINELFNNKRGNSKYTKVYCNEHKGEYEVFTGTTIGTFAFINTYDYDTPMLTYTTDGENAGTTKILEGKFNVGGHRAILVPKKENVSLEYFKYTLQKLLFDNLKKGDVPSVTWKRFKDKSILVPVDSNGECNLENQTNIVLKYKTIETKQKKLEKKINYIKEISFDFFNEKKDEEYSKKNQEEIILKSDKVEKLKEKVTSLAAPFILSKVKFIEDVPYMYVRIMLKDLFELYRGKSKYTKTYSKNNLGEYPIYSANNEKPLAYMNTFDYNGTYLTVSTNGIAGVMTILNGKFSINSDRLVFVPKVKNINNDYIKFIIEPELRNLAKGRKGLNNKNEFTKLTPKMIGNLKVSIPVNYLGEVVEKKIEEIAKKYLIIEKIRKEILNKANELLKVEISF